MLPSKKFCARFFLARAWCCRSVPPSHIFSHSFLSQRQHRAEREAGQGRAFCARRASGRSVAQSLDAAPALGTLPGGKNGRLLLPSHDFSTSYRTVNLGNRPTRIFAAHLPRSEQVTARYPQVYRAATLPGVTCHHLNPMPKAAKNSQPSTALREHEKVTLTRGGTATLRHGGSRRGSAAHHVTDQGRDRPMVRSDCEVSDSCR